MNYTICAFVKTLTKVRHWTWLSPIALPQQSSPVTVWVFLPESSLFRHGHKIDLLRCSSIIQWARQFVGRPVNSGTVGTVTYRHTTQFMYCRTACRRAVPRYWINNALFLRFSCTDLCTLSHLYISCTPVLLYVYVYVLSVLRAIYKAKDKVYYCTSKSRIGLVTRLFPWL